MKPRVHVSVAFTTEFEVWGEAFMTTPVGWRRWLLPIAFVRPENERFFGEQAEKVLPSER